MYDMVMTVKKGFNPKGYSLMPFPDSKGYDSKTMAYSLYHIIRVEDVVCHTILKGDKQVFEQNYYQHRLHIGIQTTGNELSKDEIVSFSKNININELFNYFEDVYLETNEYIKSLEFKNLKNVVSLEKKKYLYETNYVSKDESSIWLIEYWCKKNTLGLLKMPFSRHWIIHINAFLKIKNEIVKRAKKEMKNKISVCGFSCNH